MKQAAAPLVERDGWTDSATLLCERRLLSVQTLRVKGICVCVLSLPCC